MAISDSKCLVVILKRVHKKFEASDAFSFWYFFGLIGITFFLKFAVCFIKFLMFDKCVCTQSA